MLSLFAGNWAAIGREDFVAISSSLAAASGALLAISLALATFFSRHLTDWREKMYEELKLGQSELEAQMYKSAPKHPEISQRLVELYLRSAFYIRGQRLDPTGIYQASRVFDEWAKERAQEAQKSNKSFDFGNPSTYDSFEKHLFDASLRVTRVRQALVLLSGIEVAGRSIAVFPPLLATWVIIFLMSAVFAILGGTGIGNPGLYFPSLLALLYIAFIAIVSLMVSSINILMYATRALETGYGIAMSQLAKGQGYVK